MDGSLVGWVERVIHRLWVWAVKKVGWSPFHVKRGRWKGRVGFGYPQVRRCVY
jgi:hypothetical protein